MKKIPILVLFLGLGVTALFADNIKDAESYRKQGIDKFNLQDFTGAIKDLSKAIELEPKCADAYCYRGNAKHELQDFKGAVQDLGKAIEL